MNLSEMRRILAERGIQLTKSLGQNFLFDQNQLKRILAAAQLSSTDKVLEIGPGLGPLTELLVSQAREVLAIEKDNRLVEILRQRFAQAEANLVLRLIHDDALEFLHREKREWTGWKVVSNLPYSVASPLLVELCKAVRCPERIVATLQLEVARRLVAHPGTAHYGLLTLLVQADYHPTSWFKIPATCFFPAPDVDSACVTLERRPTPILPPEQRPAFEQIVKRAFSQRRKMMLKLLKTQWPAQLVDQAFERAKLPRDGRAETVPLEKFVELTQCLSSDFSYERGNF